MADQSAPPILITRKEAARLLAVSVMTIIRMQARGDLTAVQLPGGSIRCVLAEVEELARKQKRLKLVVRRPQTAETAAPPLEREKLRS